MDFNIDWNYSNDCSKLYLFYEVGKISCAFITCVIEPAGWFLLWAGLDHLVNSSKETKKDLEFYLRMPKSEIKFLTY